MTEEENPFDIPGLVTDKSSDEEIRDARNMADLMACVERVNICINSGGDTSARALIKACLWALSDFYEGRETTPKDHPTYLWREPEGTPWGGLTEDDLERIRKDV